MFLESKIKLITFSILFLVLSFSILNRVCPNHVRPPLTSRAPLEDGLDEVSKSNSRQVKMNARVALVVNEIAEHLIKLNHKVTYSDNRDRKTYQYSAKDQHDLLKHMIRLRTLCETIGHAQLTHISNYNTKTIESELSTLYKYLGSLRTKRRHNRHSERHSRTLDSVPSVEGSQTSNYHTSILEDM